MKFPAYPRYQSSGVEWLGDVPERWEVKRLKRPEGATIFQPRATPRVNRPTISSGLKGRDNVGNARGRMRMDFVAILRWPPGYAALSGLVMFGACYPGRCPEPYTQVGPRLVVPAEASEPRLRLGG